MIKFIELPKKYQVLMSCGRGNVVIKMIETLSNGREGGIFNVTKASSEINSWNYCASPDIGS